MDEWTGLGDEWYGFSEGKEGGLVNESKCSRKGSEGGQWMNGRGSVEE